MMLAGWLARGTRVLLTSSLAAVAGEPQSPIHMTLHYDVQVAWIQAGEIAMRLDESADRYLLSGTVTTTPLMDRFFRWRGQFVSAGRHGDGFPRTDIYLLWGDDGEHQETSVSFGGKTNITTSDGESEEVDMPPGSDFMSVTFLAPHCLVDATLHDGEDLYYLQLTHASEEQLELKPPYFTGWSQRCDYKFRFDDGSTRRVSLWMAEWQGKRLPVRVRVRIPLLPDGVLQLRVEDGE